MTLGERLKAWRAAAGLSSPQVQALTGINQSYIIQIEKGRSTPSPAVLAKLAQCYGVDLPRMVAGLPDLQAAQAAYMVNRAAENDREQQRRELAEAKQRAENAERAAAEARLEFEYQLAQMREALALVQSDVSAMRVQEMYAGAELDGFSGCLGQGVSLDTRVREALAPGPLDFDELCARLGVDEHELATALHSMSDELADGNSFDLRHMTCEGKARAYGGFGGLIMLEDVPDTVTSLRNVRNDAPEVWRDKVRKALAARKRGTKSGDRYWTKAYQGGRA